MAFKLNKLPSGGERERRKSEDKEIASQRSELDIAADHFSAIFHNGIRACLKVQIANQT